MSFTKNDLKTGDVVVTRDGLYFIYFDYYAGWDEVFSGIFFENYMDSSPLGTDMKNMYNLRGCDIVKVYRAPDPWIFPRSKEQIEKDYKIVFEESKKKISMSEAVKRLSEIEGCEVEIV